jgi:predicted RNA-binding Zn-ribbon protein involved in translation (DUF1610 family)
MAITLKGCAMCRGATQLAAIGELVVEEGPLKLKVDGMPAAKCAKGHATPVHQDFLLWLLGGLRERQAGLPAAEAKGLLMKKYVCACGKELPAKTESRRGFPFDFAYEGTPAFKVELDMPVYKCPGCGKEQLRSADELRKAVTTAMVDVCDRAGFPHSG